MKNCKTKKIVMFLLTIIILLTICIPIFKFYKDKKIQEHYDKIYKNFETAVKKEIDATFAIRNEWNCTHYYQEEVITYAKSLIKNGYLKKEDMKDIDNKNYCNAYAILIMKDNCNIDYKIYIKCKDYKTEGIKWNWIYEYDK